MLLARFASVSSRGTSSSVARPMVMLCSATLGARANPTQRRAFADYKITDELSYADGKKKLASVDEAI